MAILKFFMNKEDEMIAKLFMHEGEEKTDSTYKWGQYALHLAIQLNYNEVLYNPFTEDQGCSIQFLSNKIIEDNELDENGYIPVESSTDDDYYFDDDDYIDDDVDFQVFSGAFEAESPYQALQALKYDPNYVNIMLDQHEAVQVVGGLLTMTSTSGTAIHEVLKETANRLVSLRK